MKRITMVAVALSVVVASTPVSAGEFHNASPQDKLSSYAMIGSVMSLVVITAPVWLTFNASDKMLDASNKDGTGKGKATKGTTKAGPMPPLTVEKVEPQANGQVDVTLKHPDSADRAVVQWPARENNPANTLQVWDVLDLTPTAVGSGWMVAKGGGEALAFLPTEGAVQNQMSERW
jgi:hypothetical protein